MMNKTFLIVVTLCILLSSCLERRNISTMFPAITPAPSSTATFMPTDVQPTKLSATETLTPLPPYKTKQVIFDYYSRGSFTLFNAFFDPDSSQTISKLVLYEDGQLIIQGKTYKQKTLSSAEIKQFFSKLDTLGFYSIESNQKHDETDKLYNYGSSYNKRDGGSFDCVSVNTDKSRELCIYEPDVQYLIPKMKTILQFLNEYEPIGMTPYYPDRILLFKLQMPDADPINHLPAPAPAWPDNLPSLEPSKVLMYVDGKTAKDIYMLFNNVNKGEVFAYKGKDYSINMYVVLPHEIITNHYP